MHARKRSGLLRIATALLVVAGTQVAASWTTASAASPCDVVSGSHWDAYYEETEVATFENSGYRYDWEFRRMPNGEVGYRRKGAEQWNYLGNGGRIVGAPSVVQNRDGRFVVFVTGVKPDGYPGAIWFSYQITPDSSSWSAWNLLGGEGGSNPEATQNYDGRIEVFVRGTDGLIYHRWQDLNYNWNPSWAPLVGAVFNNTLVCAENARYRSDQKIVIHVRGDDNFRYSKWQYSRGGDWYPPTWWFQEFSLG